MPKKVFSEKDPINARIKIDYRGKKPKVRFSYPDKKNQARASLFLEIMVIWWILFMIIYIGSTAISDIASIPKDSEENIAYYTCMNHFEENYKDVVHSTCQIYSKNTTRIYYKYNLFKNIREEDKPTNKKEAIFWGIVFLVPFIVYYPFHKYWMKAYPKLMAIFSKKMYMVFTPKDWNNKKKYFEVPYFNNVYMSYDATKDFSKHLKYVEILEYPYHTYSKRKGKVYNEFIWYARFYYSQKPKEGRLEVIFK